MTWWKAVLQQTQPWDRSVRLQVYRRHADGRLDVLMSNGVLQTVEEAMAPPEDAGLIIPEEALEAIAEAFHPHATGQARLEGEIRALKEMLRMESARVEALLADARRKAFGDG